MAHEITVHLTDDEYAQLTIEFEKTGDEISPLIHILQSRLRARHIEASRGSNRRSPTQQAVSEALYRTRVTSSMPTGERSTREAMESLYRKGRFTSIPSGKPFPKDDEMELKRLGDLLGQGGGKLASEMVIEDRGPY